MAARLKDADMIRTPNPACPDCQLKRWHSEENWAKYHPKAGTGKDYSIK